MNQLSGHDNLGAASRQRARDHGAHAKRARGLLRVRIAFEAHDGGARLHPQRLGTGEVIDQPVSQAVGDVFDVRVLGAAFERQHRDRVESRRGHAVPSAPKERTGRNRHDGQHEATATRNLHDAGLTGTVAGRSRRSVPDGATGAE